jgi:hypothetical protein
MQTSDIFGGISDCELEAESYDLGNGLSLSKTYACIFAPFLAALSPPGPTGIDGGPWHAVSGGLRYVIRVQLHIPKSLNLKDWLDGNDTMWWIAALLRLHRPCIKVPIISDTPFDEIASSGEKPHLQPYEIMDRMLKPTEESNKFIKNEDLDWVREHWVEAGHLMKNNNKLNDAFRVFDSAMIQKEKSLALMSLWGGGEHLFSPSPGELRFRISALIASFLEKPGVKRLSLYKDLLKMYDERSIAAHTAKDVGAEKLLETYTLMRNIFVKIIEDNHVPDSDDLETLLLCATHGK